MNTLHFDKFWAWFFAVLWWPFWKWRLVEILRCWESIQNIIIYLHTNFIPPLYEKSGGYIAITLSVRPSVCPSVHTFVTLRYLSFYWKKWFYIWYMALAWWLVLCLPFPGLPHIYFLFTVRLTNERVGVFLAWCSVQHLVQYWIFAVLWRPFWKFWQRRIAPLTVTYHYVQFYVSIIIHLEIININVRNFNFPIGLYSNLTPFEPLNIWL